MSSGADALGPAFLDARVIAALRCPASGRELEARIVDGRPVLATRDGAFVYAIRDGVPILLPPRVNAAGAAARPSPTVAVPGT